MTIDEAIGIEKREQIKCENDMNLYKRELCRKLIVDNAEYHKQLAEWLEELVMLRLDSCMIHMSERLHLVENGYNKALNDFVNVCERQFTTMYGQRYVDMRDIKEIAEQLKAGITND